MNRGIAQKFPQLKKLFSRYGVVEAHLFGSAATDSIKPSSDVDFLIRFDSSLDYVAYADNYFALLNALRELLNRDVDLVAEETVRNPFFAQRLAETKIRVL